MSHITASAATTTTTTFKDSFNNNSSESQPDFEYLNQAAAAMSTNDNNVGFWDSITDPRVNEYYLLRGGPTIILSIVGVYLVFVLSIGPKLMARHEPFKLNSFLLIYNVSMATANLWLFVQGLLVSNYGLDTWGCGKFGGDIRQSPRRGIYLGYLFFLTKLVELLDTIFFVLRKKDKQVTFLHVFHHSIVPIFCWIGIKLAPGGPNGFFPLINSFIHVIMYSYYALTTFGPRIQPYLWWKKYLTTMQMIQFVLVMINAAKTFMSQDCKFPILFSYLQATVASAFFVLFASFYKNAYSKKPANKQHQAKQHRPSINNNSKKTKNATTVTTTTTNNNNSIVKKLLIDEDEETCGKAAIVDKNHNNGQEYPIVHKSNSRQLTNKSQNGKIDEDCKPRYISGQQVKGANYIKLL